MNRYNVLPANVFKSLACLVLLTSLLTAVLLAIVPASGYAQEPERTEQCVHFNDWKEGEYRAKFVKDDFIFTSLSSEPLFIRWTDTPEGAALGLQIPEQGVNVSLPQFASQVVLRYRTDTSAPLDIEAFTRTGEMTDDRTFPSKPGIVYTVTVSSCASYDIRGGGNEAILLEVCVEVESEQPVAELVITRVEPAEGRCDSEMVLTVFGANFRPGLSVFIPKGIEIAGTKFISPEELQAGIFIAPDIPPGPRPVEVIDLESREVLAILETGFTVVCPRPQPPEGRPDLVLLWADWEIFGEDLLVITAEVENVGEVPAPEAPIYVESRTANWWAAEAIVPGLDSGSSAEVHIELGIPDELRDMSHPFLVFVDPGNEIAEVRDDNNWRDIEVSLGDEGPSIAAPPDLIIPMVILVGVAVLAMTLSIRRSRRIRRHKRCQENAKEEEPPDTCQPCTRYCRKIDLELKPARRKIARLSLRTGETVSDESSKESELPDEIVDGLNKVVTARRQREKAVRLQKQIASLANRILEHVMEWLRGEPAPQDVYISGYLVGGKVICQFILYHCKRRGNMNIWEEEEKWKATVEDKRDEPVGMLGELNPAEPKIPERLVSELNRLLTEFIGKV